jgi:undecaprenyl-diphosphatase
LIHIDEKVFFWINSLAGRVAWIDDVIRILSCDVFIPVLFIIVLIAIWFAGHDREARARNQRGVLCALASMGIANGLVFIVNHILPFRVRPCDAFPLSTVHLPGTVYLLFYHPTVSSFPSDAAAASFAVATGMWVYNRKLGYILLIPAIILSFGHVYMGVHYPSDIISGFAVAIVATGIVFVAMKLGRPIFDWVLKLARKIYLG